MFFERRVVIVRIATPHNESLLDPTAMGGRGIASPRGRVASPGSAIAAAGVAMMSMPLCRIGRFANAAIAIGNEGHDAGHLLDFELLARPAQALSQRPCRRHHRTTRTARIHATRAAAPATLTATPA